MTLFERPVTRGKGLKSHQIIEAKIQRKFRNTYMLFFSNFSQGIRGKHFIKNNLIGLYRQKDLKNFFFKIFVLHLLKRFS